MIIELADGREARVTFDRHPNGFHASAFMFGADSSDIVAETASFHFIGACDHYAGARLLMEMDVSEDDAWDAVRGECTCEG